MMTAQFTANKEKTAPKVRISERELNANFAKDLKDTQYQIGQSD